MRGWRYFRYALQLSRPGSVIVVDNVVRRLGPDADPQDPNVIGVRRLLEDLKQEKRVSATAIQTVGSKGYDGFAYILVLE
jgi:predicted O-methyltransferase YrrM